jgi:hypothetical protein
MDNRLNDNEARGEKELESSREEKRDRKGKTKEKSATSKE